MFIWFKETLWSCMNILFSMESLRSSGSTASIYVQATILIVYHRRYQKAQEKLTESIGQQDRLVQWSYKVQTNWRLFFRFPKMNWKVFAPFEKALKNYNHHVIHSLCWKFSYNMLFLDADGQNMSQFRSENLLLCTTN